MYTNRLFGLQQPYFLLQSSVFDLQLKYNKANYHFRPLKQLELGNLLGMLCKKLNTKKRVFPHFRTPKRERDENTTHSELLRVWKCGQTLSWRIHIYSQSTLKLKRKGGNKIVKIWTPSRSGIPLLRLDKLLMTSKKTLSSVTYFEYSWISCSTCSTFLFKTMFENLHLYLKSNNISENTK